MKGAERGCEAQGGRKAVEKGNMKGGVREGRAVKEDGAGGQR